MRRIFLLALFLVAAAPAAAQQTITVGQTVEGELSEFDLVDDDGVQRDVWAFRARRGATYLVTLRSDDFDAHLRVGAPDEDECAGCFITDDDGGGGLDAQVVLYASRQGRFVIHARALAGGRGAYRLSLEDGTGMQADSVLILPEDTTYRESAPLDAYVRPGQRYEGVLVRGDLPFSYGGLHDALGYQGRAGETVTVTLRSTDFDALLEVGRWKDGLWEELARDDDGGGGTDSRITLTLPDDGEYILRAGALYVGEVGSYQLRLVSRGRASGAPRPAPAGTAAPGPR